ncbi:MAG: substrate-binding domain-containing protein, partial [Paracoccaceae bacterium]|nr:substrate-binding domain-containing protein [Paracoccaceae bacterium]
SRKTHTIGLVISEITNPFYAEMVAGIDAVLDRCDRIAFIANTDESITRQDRFIQRIREQGVDGIILTAAEGTGAEVIERLRSWRMPCVQALRQVSGNDADYVGPDYRMGLGLAVQHLVNLGHRRIAYIGGARKTSATRERMAGFRESMARHGIEPGPIVPCIATREYGARAIRDLLATQEPPTAAVCYNDITAFGVIHGLLELGRKPGQDFGVIGFDNIAEAALGRPALTTVAIEPQQIGEQAATLLLRRIENPDGGAERIILPPRLIIRDT